MTGIFTYRNLVKFLKALRTESIWKVFKNVVKRFIRALAKSYQKAQLEFNGAKPSVLWVLPNLPQKDKSSGERRLYHLFEILAPYLEIYIFTEGSRHHKSIKGVTILPEISFSKLKKANPYFNFLIFSWFTTYEDCKELQDLYPNSKTIIDSVDLHWIREERAIGTVKGLTPSEANRTKVRELSCYKEVDEVWTVTYKDREVLLKEIKGLSVQVVSNVHHILPLKPWKPTSKSIIYVGSYAHFPNLKAAEYLACSIFPEILIHHPDATLILAGADPPKDIKNLAVQDKIFVTDQLEDHELNALYHSASMTVVPLFSGSGIKGKICEAIAYGIPVITNDIGNEGIDLIHEKEALIISPSQMAKGAITLLDGLYDVPAMRIAAQQKLATIVAPQVVSKSLMASFFNRVTICIVTHNKLDLLKACLDSIIKNTSYPNYRVLVYSNSCQDGTVEFLKSLAERDDRIIPIFSSTNDVFVLPNNQMMEYSESDDVVLLNNDTEVTKGWLLALQAAVYSDKKIGIAGSKLLFPDGSLQEFGSEIFPDGAGFNRGKGENPNEMEYQGIRQTAYVSGCAMYIKRSTIEQIGEFDTQFHPCYYEDSDYCYTALQSGLITVVTAHSIVVHHEGATSGTDLNEGMKRYQMINKQKFISKHFQNICS